MKHWLFGIRYPKTGPSSGFYQNWFSYYVIGLVVRLGMRCLGIDPDAPIQ